MASLQDVASAYVAALAADDANPQPSYSLNGKSVSRTEWRESLMRLIGEARRLDQAANPFIVRTRFSL